MNQNPYEPPKSDLQASVGANDSDAPRPKIWNPNAIGLWSVLFTPIFGSVLLLINWEALEEGELEQEAKRALVVSVVVAGIAFLVPLLTLIYLVAWYFIWQRPQAQYVAERWGNAYARKSWAFPIFMGLMVLIAQVCVQLALR